MKLAKIIRNAVAIADKATTTDIQVPVQHYAWIGNGTTYAEPLYDRVVERLAIVTMREKMIRTPDGKDVLQRAEILFPRPIEANGADERHEPIDIRDKLVLPNGYTGPVIKVEGLANNYSDSPYMTKVILG